MLAVLINHFLDWFVTQHLLTDTLVTQEKSEVEGEVKEQILTYKYIFFFLVEADIYQ